MEEAINNQKTDKFIAFFHGKKPIERLKNYNFQRSKGNYSLVFI